MFTRLFGLRCKQRPPPDPPVAANPVPSPTPSLVPPPAAPPPEIIPESDDMDWPSADLSPRGPSTERTYYSRPPPRLCPHQKDALLRKPPGSCTNTSSQFPKFGELPTEIRLKIWAFSLPGPQILYIQHSLQHDYFFSASHVPSAFLVCHESRAEAKRFYIRIPDSTLLPDGEDRLMRFYFNPSQDTLFLSKSCWRQGAAFLDRIEGPPVRHVAMGLRTAWVQRMSASWYEWLSLLKERLSSQGTVSVVVGWPEAGWSPCLSFLDAGRGYAVNMERVDPDTGVSGSSGWDGPAVKCVKVRGCPGTEVPVYRTLEREYEYALGWEVIREYEIRARAMGKIHEL